MKKRQKKCYSLQSSIVNSSRVSKASIHLCQDCLCQGTRELAWLLLVMVRWELGPEQLSCWEMERPLSGSSRHNCPNSFHDCRSTSPDFLPSLVHPLLLYHYFPCKSIPASLMLLLLILGTAIFDFQVGAEKPWVNSGQTLLYVWPLETLDLGTSVIVAFQKSRCGIKLSSVDMSCGLHLSYQAYLKMSKLSNTVELFSFGWEKMLDLLEFYSCSSYVPMTT